MANVIIFIIECIRRLLLSLINHSPGPIKRFLKTRLYGSRFNPLYSPSYHYNEMGKMLARDITRGLNSKEPFKGFSPEAWDAINRSARAATFWQDEDEEEIYET